MINVSVVYRFILISFFLLTLIVYLFIPNRGEVSMPLFYISFSGMLLSNLIYFKAKRKINYLDFDTIFILVYCLVGFTTTFFYYNNYEVFRAAFLNFPVAEEYINKGNLLFLLGLLCYMLGSLTHVKSDTIRIGSKRKINTTFLVVNVFSLIILFIFSGGIEYYRAIYAKTSSVESGIVKYVLLLLITTAMVLVGSEYYNKKIDFNYRISKMSFIALFVIIGTLMFIGNRTAASQILLPVLCLYAIFFKNINFRKFLVFIFIGIPIMWIFQQVRTGESNFELTNPIMLILDLTIPMRTTYEALAYVDVNSYTYGMTMVLAIVGAIPFLPSFIVENFPKMEMGSAELLTNYTYSNIYIPDEFQIGLGTTIIADIYLAFGLVGIIVLMFFMGLWVNRLLVKSTELNYYSIIIFCAILGNAIFIVRAGYFHAFRFIVLALLIAYINKLLQNAFKK